MAPYEECGPGKYKDEAMSMGTYVDCAPCKPLCNHGRGHDQVQLCKLKCPVEYEELTRTTVKVSSTYPPPADNDNLQFWVLILVSVVVVLLLVALFGVAVYVVRKNCRSWCVKNCRWDAESISSTDDEEDVVDKHPIPEVGIQDEEIGLMVPVQPEVDREDEMGGMMQPEEDSAHDDSHESFVMQESMV